MGDSLHERRSATVSSVLTSELWRAFAAREAAGSSPTYERLAYAVAEDGRIPALLDGLPEGKRQPNLLLGVGRFLQHNTLT